MSYVSTSFRPVQGKLTQGTAGGKMCTVQVHAELKVYEVIRRICSKADVMLAVTASPRLSVGDTFVGHGMMMGEVGVQQDSKVDVAFSYDEDKA